MKVAADILTNGLVILIFIGVLTVVYYGIKDLVESTKDSEE